MVNIGLPSHSSLRVVAHPVHFHHLSASLSHFMMRGRTGNSYGIQDFVTCVGVKYSAALFCANGIASSGISSQTSAKPVGLLASNI